MSGSSLYQAAKALMPKAGEIAVIGITTSSAATQLTATAQLGAKALGRFVTMISDVGVYYAFGGSDVEVDETATTGAKRAFFLPAGVEKSAIITGEYIALKGGEAGNLRVAISGPRA